jgi:MarR family transcriptional regulator, transcriptional regulator for hemolysin
MMAVPTMSLEREIAFNINDVARLLKTYADQRARDFGMTRAQWAVLARVERSEGLKQCELADTLDLQPITLTRLIDRLCDGGLIERRSDPEDRRAKRLFLTPAARPVLDGLTRLGEDIMTTVLAGIEPAAVEQLLAHLLILKTNLRGAIANRANETAREKRYG